MTVYTTQQQNDLLLSGMVDKARRQLGLFRVLLIIVSTIIMALIIYTLTLDKIHDIAHAQADGRAQPRHRAASSFSRRCCMGAFGYGAGVVDWPVCVSAVPAAGAD